VVRLTIFAYANMEPTAAQHRIDRMFRAFSDRTRIRILHLLRDGDLCVGDVVTILGIPQAKTSRHLAYLRRAGLVTARDERLWTFYSLAPANDLFHKRLLDCLSACLDEVPELAGDARRAQKIRKSGGCCPR
jgi:ArsR family transcriptional regulator